MLSLFRGGQAVKVGSICAVGQISEEPQFHLLLNTTSFTPLECHFALYLGISSGALLVCADFLLSSSNLE